MESMGWNINQEGVRVLQYILNAMYLYLTYLSIVIVVYTTTNYLK